MRALLTQRAGTRPTPCLVTLLTAFLENGVSLAASEQPAEGPPGAGSAGGGEVFSARETAVLRLLEVGHTHKQIARELQLSPNTVRWYMTNLYLKLQVNNRTEAPNRTKAMGLL
jgi:LuxR family maltose regulon positive regulatory protein